MDEFEVFDVKPFVSRLLGDFSIESKLFALAACCYLFIKRLHHLFRHGRLVWFHG